MFIKAKVARTATGQHGAHTSTMALALTLALTLTLGFSLLIIIVRTQSTIIT
jgi:hypothetical protein